MNERIRSIDTVRGLVMVIMALDHTRDFIHADSLAHNPVNLATTYPALFFTRWITHLCAPTFVCLSGVSVFLTVQKLGAAATRKFLFTRGIWLILLELTIINFGVWWDIHFNVIFFNVISAIGTGFIVLALLIKLPARTIGIIGLVIIFGHNLAPLVPAAETSLFKKIAMPLFAPTAYPLGGTRFFVMGYAPIPWWGIMFAGFGAGKWFLLTPPLRKNIFGRTGIAAVILFIIIRAINVYGDAGAWAHQQTALFSFLSFINLTKYPPSLDFCLLFLGLMFLLLYLAEGAGNFITRITGVYGKVPLFYFLVHWYIIHPVMFAMVFMQGFTRHQLLFVFNFGRPKDGSGLPLWGVYLVWAGTVLLLYPVCKWYGNYKSSHDHWWLKYI